MTAPISIVGIGNGGCKVMDRVAESLNDASPVAVINTDMRALEACHVPTILQIGSDRTRGLGTGGDAGIGKQVALGEREKFGTLFSGKRLVILVVCLGGGTGTGAAPVLAQAARDAGAASLCIATFPFDFEGDQRRVQANVGIADLREVCDALVVVQNDRLSESVGDESLERVFNEANATLSRGVEGVYKMVSRPGYIQLGVEEIRQVLQKSGGVCSLGCGEASGQDKAVVAVRSLLESPMTERGRVLQHARSLLVSIVGGADLTLKEVGDVMSEIKEAARDDSEIFMGTVVDDAWQDRLTVTAIMAEQWVHHAQGTRESARPEQVALPGMETEVHLQAPTPSELQAAGGRTKGRSKTTLQTKLTFASTGRDRFKGAEPTVLDGENLDIPAFLRRGIAIDR